MRYSLKLLLILSLTATAQPIQTTGTFTPNASKVYDLGPMPKMGPYLKIDANLKYYPRILIIRSMAGVPLVFCNCDLQRCWDVSVKGDQHGK